MKPQTLYDKLWNSHVIENNSDGTSLIYIDRQLLHEVTSPQAFEGLRLAGRNVWNKQSQLATPDHNVPTVATERKNGIQGITDPISRLQVQELDTNCKKNDIKQFPMHDIRQGIVHVVGPEQGFTQPGMTIVCGDSHTATHGAFAALAQGIGTSEVEHVLATQCLLQKKTLSMLITIEGTLGFGVTAKDIILYIISKIGTAGGTGYTIEFNGNTIEALSMESRMTICNMAIEAGARAGIIGVDDKTIAYLKNRPYSPTEKYWESATQYWKTLKSDKEAVFDTTHHFMAEDIAPQVSWGTSPEMTCAVTENVPQIIDADTQQAKKSLQLSLDYMGLQGGEQITAIEIDAIFIGSCTNGRIEDLRSAANIVQGKHIAKTIQRALVVPGSGLVKIQAEKEKLDIIFKDAGFEWREPGCSMCLAMNSDKLNVGERCASTSNRNFEGRQGFGGRTHLVSPAMAAAAAIAGHFVDIRDWR